MSCILVPNHVQSSLISHSLPHNLTAINLMAIKLNVKSVNIIWHVLPFQLRPDAVGATSRRIAFCVATYRLLRRHVSPAASPRSFGGIGRTVTSYVG